MSELVSEREIRTLVEKILREHSEQGVALASPAAGNPEPELPAESGCLLDLSCQDLQAQLLVANPCREFDYYEMKRATPARLGVGRCGTRPLTATILRFRADHALAQDSVWGMLPGEFVERFALLPVQTQAADKDQYLTRPDLGRKLSEEGKKSLQTQATGRAQVQIVASDGLSSKALGENLPDLLPALLQGLKQHGLTAGKPIFVRYGRVACMDEIGDLLEPEVLILLIGERPGLGNAESLSAYMAYHPHSGMLESERTVISNIHRRGTPPVEAGAHLAGLLKKMLEQKQSGVNFV